MGCNGNSGNQFFINHICRFVGETVTIFTTSGGISGCGFTGVVLAVNCDFVRLVIQQGSAPSSPFDNSNDNCYCNGGRVGSVCDIPVDRIASFVHNAV